MRLDGGIRQRRRLGRRLLRLALVIAVIVAVPWLAGMFWFAGQIPLPGAPATTGTSEAIVVLTGGSGRLAEGLRLLTAGGGKKLFVSGVYHGVDVTRLLRLARQAPGELECCIVLGYSADDTVGNARETAAWMKSEGYRSIRLVTANYHMPRSLLEFRREMPRIVIIPHPVFPDRFMRSQWWRWPGSAGLIAREFNKYLAALVGLSGIGGASS